MANKGVENLIQWKKGQSGNPKGRPRKLVTQLEECGYTKQEVQETMLIILALTMDELEALYENPEATVLEKTIANALSTGIKKGSLYSVMEILTRAIGKPREEVDVKADMTVKGVTVRVVQVETPFASCEEEVVLN